MRLRYMTTLPLYLLMGCLCYEQPMPKYIAIMVVLGITDIVAYASGLFKRL